MQITQLLIIQVCQLLKLKNIPIKRNFVINKSFELIIDNLVEFPTIFIGI